MYEVWKVEVDEFDYIMGLEKVAEVDSLETAEDEADEWRRVEYLFSMVSYDTAIKFKGEWVA